jgi:rhodanese-related sulfurtransferase
MDHSPGFLKIVESVMVNVKEITGAEVLALQETGKPFELIDVREESEFAASHIPGARHIGKGILERDIEQAVPNPAAEVILYCGGGFRSALAADTLQRMGYTNVRSMAGGFRHWPGPKGK